MAINDNSDVDSNNGMKNCNDIYSNHEDDHNSIIKALFIISNVYLTGDLAAGSTSRNPTGTSC